MKNSSKWWLWLEIETAINVDLLLCITDLSVFEAEWLQLDYTFHNNYSNDFHKQGISPLTVTWIRPRYRGSEHQSTMPTITPMQIHTQIAILRACKWCYTRCSVGQFTCLLFLQCCTHTTLSTCYYHQTQMNIGTFVIISKQKLNSITKYMWCSISQNLLFVTKLVVWLLFRCVHFRLYWLQETKSEKSLHESRMCLHLYSMASITRLLDLRLGLQEQWPHGHV